MHCVYSEIKLFLLFIPAVNPVANPNSCQVEYHSAPKLPGGNLKNIVRPL